MLRLKSNFLKKYDGSYFSQYFITFTLSLCFFSAGQHYGWAVPYLPRILSGELDISMDEAEASYLAMIGAAGDVIGAYISTFLIDKIGRKYAILSISIPQILGFVLTYFGNDEKALLYCARISGGIGEGAFLAIAPTYLSEVAIPRLRGILNLMVGVAFPLGFLFVNVVGSYRSMQTTALVSLVMPAVFVVTFSFAPESPYYLLMKDRREEAEDSLQVLRRCPDVRTELSSLTKDVARQMSERGSYRELFTIPTNRLALTLVVVLRACQQFTGYSAIFTYTQVLLKESSDFSPMWGSSILLIVQLAMNIFSAGFIERMGRRFLLITSSISTFAVLFSLGTFYALRDYTTLDTTGWEWLPLALLVVYVVGFMFGYGAVPSVFTSEVFSASIKSKALGINGAFFAAYMMSSIKLYQFLADNVGMAVCFYVFSLFTFLSILFVCLLVPETKGKTLEEIQQDLMKRRKKK